MLAHVSPQTVPTTVETPEEMVGDPSVLGHILSDTLPADQGPRGWPRDGGAGAPSPTWAPTICKATPLRTMAETEFGSFLEGHASPLMRAWVCTPYAAITGDGRQATIQARGARSTRAPLAIADVAASDRQARYSPRASRMIFWYSKKESLRTRCRSPVPSSCLST